MGDLDHVHPVGQTAVGATIGLIGANGVVAGLVAMNTFGAGGISAWLSAMALMGLTAGTVLPLFGGVVVAGTLLALWGGRQVVRGVKSGVKRMKRGY